MLNYYLILNFLFYLLGVYHFSTFNILEFWDVKSIINGYSDSNTSLKFLIVMELLLLLGSFVLQKNFKNVK